MEACLQGVDLRIAGWKTEDWEAGLVEGRVAFDVSGMVFPGRNANDPLMHFLGLVASVQQQ